MEKPEKKALSVSLPPDLIERARRVAYFVPGVTIVSLVEAGLEREVARVERKHADLMRQPRGQLRRGRRPKPKSL